MAMAGEIVAQLRGAAAEREAASLPEWSRRVPLSLPQEPASPKQVHASSVCTVPHHMNCSLPHIHPVLHDLRALIVS